MAQLGESVMVEAVSQASWTHNSTYSGVDSGLNQSNIGLSSNDRFYLYLWTYVAPAIFGLIVVVGTAGNSLVLYVIVSRKAMRTVTNILLLNLAVADISFLLICVPFTAIKYAASTWPFGDLACKFMKYFLYVASYVTVYTLVAISALRFLTIVCSTSTIAYRTKQNAVMLICFIWLLMFVVNSPALLVHKTKTFDATYSYCGVNEDAIEPLIVTFFVFAYVLPLYIICLLYLLIMLHLRRARAASSLVDSSERTTRAFKVIILVVVVFGLSWLPSHVNSLVGQYGTIPGGASYEVFRIIWNCMAYGNSCVNPFIYNYMSHDFRKCFREVICCGRQERAKTRRNRLTDNGNNTEQQTMV